jgi:hypothetical protein
MYVPIVLVLGFFQHFLSCTHLTPRTRAAASLHDTARTCAATGLNPASIPPFSHQVLCSVALQFSLSPDLYLQSSSRRCAALSFVKAAQVLHSSDEYGQGRLALGLRAAAPPLAFINPATIRSSCSRRSLCCDIIPALRLLSPVVLAQSLPDTRRRRHLRTLARSLPEEALAFLAHTALQTPIAFDGSVGSDAAAGREFDLDVDDADEECSKDASVTNAESSGVYRGVIEKNIYGYGEQFTVRFTLEGRLHMLGSFPAIEEARAARDAALLGAHAAAAAGALGQRCAGASARVFTTGEDGEAGDAEGRAAASKLTTIAE